MATPLLARPSPYWPKGATFRLRLGPTFAIHSVTTDRAPRSDRRELVANQATHD